LTLSVTGSLELTEPYAAEGVRAEHPRAVNLPAVLPAEYTTPADAITAD
jgi:hypothetical protein